MKTVNSVGAGASVGSITPEETVGATAVEAGSPDLLPGAAQLLGCGDPGAELAALVSMSARSQKKMASELRKSEEAMLKKAEDEQVSALHRQANLALASGIVGGVSAFASAGLELGSKLEGVKAQGLREETAGAKERAAEAHGASPAMKDHIARTELAASSASRRSAVYAATAGIAGGFEKLGTAGLGAMEKHAAIDGTRAEQAAGRAKRAIDAADEMKDDARRLLEKGLDFYRDWTQGHAGAAQAALRRA